MKIILKEDVRGIGRKYEIKNVSDGYANNFLIPKKLAEYASSEAIKKYEAKKAADSAEIEVRQKLAAKQVEMLQGVAVSLKKKSNEKGHLFEKIHPQEISEALRDQARIDIDPEFLILENPVKETGEHRISVQVGQNKGEFVLVVEGVSA